MDFSNSFRGFVKNIFAYFVVGLGATIVEWAAFFLLGKILGVHYLFATALAITLSTFSNWAFGRLLAFRHFRKGNAAIEILKVYLVSLAGLAFNILIMWILVGKFSADEMLSKIIATGIVFFYNYFARKIFIYTRKQTKHD